MKKLKHILKRFVFPILAVRPRNIMRYGHYVHSLAAYRRMGGSTSSLWPILGEDTPITSIDPHYFYQGAWAFRHIAQIRPEKHIDVGSQTDLVAHLSAIMPTTFVDVRPLLASLPGLTVVAGSVLSLPFLDSSVPSLSCLHVVEHIGLGRYGDSLDPNGTRKACAELARILAPGGTLYLSLPIGRERTEFNAHRVHLPGTILGYFPQLSLEEFSIIDDRGVFVRNANVGGFDDALYACGLLRFTKRKNSEN